MLTQNTTPLTSTDLDGMTLEARIELLLTTTSTADIDLLESRYHYCLNKQPLFRKSLYEVARQNARYQRALAPDEPLPVINVHLLTMPDALALLRETNDTQVVDTIDLWTEGRPKKLPEFRVGLFEIARQGVAYRLAALEGAQVAV
ncbi:hypothetical protein [Spirosoma areae]